MICKRTSMDGVRSECVDKWWRVVTTIISVMVKHSLSQLAALLLQASAAAAAADCTSQLQHAYLHFEWIIHAGLQHQATTR